MKNLITSEVYQKQSGNRGVSPKERERSLWWEWFVEKIGFKPRVKERGVMDDERDMNRCSGNEYKKKSQR